MATPSIRESCTAFANATPGRVRVQPRESDTRLRFVGGSDFHRVVRERVDAYFVAAGIGPRDSGRMYLKTAIVAAWFVAAYVLLVFVATAWWQAVPLALLLAFATAAIGFDVMHDGGHQAYSDRPWVNTAMAMSLDLVGGSSYIWRWKHGVFHHTYVNIQGYDGDIDLGVLARLAPDQPRRWYQRWQHVYAWLLYGVTTMRWHFYGDFRDLVAGNARTLRFPRPTGWPLFGLVAGKLAFFALWFGIPLLFHPVGTVLAFYALVMFVNGVLLAVVFQLAHCVEQAGFEPPPGEDREIRKPWAIHQVESTVDFARGNRALAWFLGGLNFQVEHHLFPRVCHVHYPAISAIVERTCGEFGVRYRENRTLRDGVASHYRWLRRMGRGDSGAALSQT